VPKIFLNPPEKETAPMCAYLTEKAKTYVAIVCVFLPIIILIVISLTIGE